MYSFRGLMRSYFSALKINSVCSGTPYLGRRPEKTSCIFEYKMPNNCLDYLRQGKYDTIYWKLNKPGK